MGLKHRIVSETVGTAGLLVAVVGSGIAVSRSAASDAVALEVHAWVVGAALVALIVGLGSWSTHFNPAVTLALWGVGTVARRDAVPLIAGQCVGALHGVGLADAMFGVPVFELGTKVRTGVGLWLGEGIATFGLVLLILGAAVGRSSLLPLAVGLYVAAAIWFTSSCAFANPAVTLARAFTDTWTGIRPRDIPMFVVAEALGAVAAVFLVRWLAAAQPGASRDP